MFFFSNFLSLDSTKSSLDFCQAPCEIINAFNLSPFLNSNSNYLWERSEEPDFGGMVFSRGTVTQCPNLSGLSVSVYTSCPGITINILPFIFRSVPVWIINHMVILLFL